MPRRPSVPFAGRARSIRELYFAADLRACEYCGAREPVDWAVLPVNQHDPATRRYWVHAPCPRCQEERSYRVGMAADLAGVSTAPGHLGGPEPSTMLTAAELAAEIERLAPAITTDETVTRDGEGAKRNHERYSRIRTALIELAKFIPEGTAEVPGLPRAAAAVPHARPGRYTRAWIAGELAYWEQLGHLPGEYFPGRRGSAEVGLAQVRAHRDWLDRGRAGDGRLVLTGGYLPFRLGTGLTASRWEGVQGAHGDYNNIGLSEAELTDVDLSHSSLDYARLDRARLTRCTLDGCTLSLASLDGAQLTDCSLQQLWTDRTSWRGAQVTRARMALAQLGSGRLDGARFADCDMRRAWFTPRQPAGYRATAAGAVFERCDLRGAHFTGASLAGVTFVRCLFRGTTGRPAATDGWQVIDADFSAAGDGSDLGGADDLLEQLGQDHDPRMTERTIRYSAGSEDNPADPFGRSELVLQANGAARLDHHFSRAPRTGAWTGQVAPAAVAALLAALDEAGFPDVPGPPGRRPPDETLRTLIVEAGGAARQVSLGWHQVPPQPGYAVAFDILDGVIRQLSGAAVPYRSAQPPIVSDIVVLA